mgnify:CR=1 FL=1
MLLCVISIKYVTFVGKLWTFRKLRSEDKECPWREKRKNTADGACFFSGWRFRENHQYNIKYIFFLMKIVNLGTMPSVVNCYMAQLRDVNYQKNRTLFRGNLERIGHAMAYELSRTLSYSLKEVQTPLGVKPVPTYDDHIVVGTVLRAGLAFHQGFLDVFDQADAGFVAAYREEGKREDIRIHLEYMAAPNLQDSTFLLVDPMLATGGSLELAYKTFLRLGTPKKLHICCVIAAEEGIEHLKKVFPSDDVTLWVAAVDPALNDDAYIVPGLGDAGDLSFGEKISLR